MTRNMSLLRTQQNEVLKMLLPEGFVSADFRWEVEGSAEPFMQDAVVSVLRFEKDERFFFKFDYALSGEPSATRSPGRNVGHDTRRAGNWTLQLGNVREWAKLLRDEVDAPDLWNELVRLPGAILPTPPAGSGPFYWREQFTQPEIAVLTANVNAFQRSVEEKLTALFDVGELNAGALAGQLAFVREELDTLRESSKRQTRLSWYQLAIGVATSIITAIPPEHRATLFHGFAATVLGLTYFLGK